MNYDLAVMALDGLARGPLTIREADGMAMIEGSAASFKELARLCLLLGGDSANAGEEFELQPSRHLTPGSKTLRLRRTS
jgi:hypothetical protein